MSYLRSHSVKKNSTRTAYKRTKENKNPKVKWTATLEGCRYKYGVLQVARIFREDWQMMDLPKNEKPFPNKQELFNCYVAIFPNVEAWYASHGKGPLTPDIVYHRLHKMFYKEGEGRAKSTEHPDNCAKTYREHKQEWDKDFEARYGVNK